MNMTVNDAPTDTEIAQIVSDRRGLPTYVICNTLRMIGYRGLKTAWVRRQLVRMSIDGKVERDERAEYGQHHCWKIP